MSPKKHKTANKICKNCKWYRPPSLPQNDWCILRSRPTTTNALACFNFVQKPIKACLHCKHLRWTPRVRTFSCPKIKREIPEKKLEIWHCDYFEEHKNMEPTTHCLEPTSKLSKESYFLYDLITNPALKYANLKYSHMLFEQQKNNVDEYLNEYATEALKKYENTPNKKAFSKKKIEVQENKIEVSTPQLTPYSKSETPSKSKRRHQIKLGIGRRKVKF